MSTSPSNASDSSTRAPAAARGRALIFTGHMIDAPGRERPRFPAEKEGAARRAIKEAVAAEMRSGGGVSLGIAGGASGGDILFHEVCEESGVETRLFLALPPRQYVAESVEKAGGRWVERFWKLYNAREARGRVRVLDDEAAVPHGSNLWQRTNLWMLHEALAEGGDDGVTLIALWDGEPTGDGTGGASDLVRQAAARGARAVVIDTRQLFGL